LTILRALNWISFELRYAPSSELDDEFAARKRVVNGACKIP
jgi:hypothetical protein